MLNYSRTFDYYNQTTVLQLIANNMSGCFFSETPCIYSELFYVVLLLRMLQHPNLVRLLGVRTTSQPILILTEYMRNGIY